MTKQDFIDIELAPFAGDFEQDFDLGEVFDALYHDGIIELRDGSDFAWATDSPDLAPYFEAADITA